MFEAAVIHYARVSIKSGAVALSLCLLSAPPTIAADDPLTRPECRLFQTETDFAEFDMFTLDEAYTQSVAIQPSFEKTVRLRVPAIYLQNRGTDGGSEPRFTAGLNMHVETLEPGARAYERLKHDRDALREWVGMNVLINNRSGIARQLYVGVRTNSEIRDPPMELDELIQMLGVKAARYGLQILDFVPSRGLLQEQFLNFTGEGELSDVIACSQIGSVNFPRCEHFFQHHRMKVKTSYPREYLAEWRNIRNRLKIFLDCAVQTAP